MRTEACQAALERLILMMEAAGHNWGRVRPCWKKQDKGRLTRVLVECTYCGLYFEACDEAFWDCGVQRSRVDACRSNQAS